MLSLWAKTRGTWINVVLVLLGTGSGLLLRGRLHRSMQDVITQAVGLITIFIGVQMAQPLTEVNAGAIAGVIVGLVALVAGGLLGEWWRVEQRLVAIGNGLKARFGGGGQFSEGSHAVWRCPVDADGMNPLGDFVHNWPTMAWSHPVERLLKK